MLFIGCSLEQIQRSTDGHPAVQLHAQLLADHEQLRERDAGILCADTEIEVEELHNLLHDTGTDTTANLIKKEFLRTPHILNHTAEHPQGKHIEKQVGETGVEKLVSQELEEMEILGHEEMQSADCCKVASLHLKQPRSGKSHDVDDKKILCDSRYVSEHLCD